jgi:hypothetical protein
MNSYPAVTQGVFGPSVWPRQESVEGHAHTDEYIAHIDLSFTVAEWMQTPWYILQSGKTR